MANERIQARDPQDTPMMRQYLALKEEYPDTILFYRMGDFYEMFFEDAIAASAALDLTLTSRNKNDPDPIPMCGFPHHASIGYVSRLIEQGFKVAVCEQMEDPSKVKGLVKREVTRIVTPGVVLDEENLESRANNWLAAIAPLDAAGTEAVQLGFAVAIIDASTFEFRATQVTGSGALAGELYRIEPREILVPASGTGLVKDLKRLLPRCHLSVVDDGFFAPTGAFDVLKEAIGETDCRDIFSTHPHIGSAAGAAITYVRATRPGGSLPPCRLALYSVADHLVIDEATKAHLELVRTSDGDKKGSLLWLLDQTCTAMGGRLLRHWINYPLVDPSLIRTRQDRVDAFFQDATFRDDTRSLLPEIADLERIATRIGMGASTPRDLGVLRNSLAILPNLNALLASCTTRDAEAIFGGALDAATDLHDALDRALVADPPVSARDGGVFKEGFSSELDDLTTTLATAKDFISGLEERERRRTGINSLKVSYNKVFGYFILITKSNLKNVPDDYVRKQTIVNGERFVTRELEEWESKVLTADDRRRAMEQELLKSLVSDLSRHVPRLSAIARRIAAIDCAQSLGHVARKRDYNMPLIGDDGILHIEEGRHPLVEALFETTPFVPNDVILDPAGERLLIITGPNMAGKSTVMRQVALMAILTQMGAFVPARSARMPIVDRLFTRVGASDNIARGASTFMVEMNETSAILRGATADSLVILDEVGRGTSTWDGLSIAWSVGEYLHDLVKCKTMFATHYHELVELGNIKTNAANYHVAAREYGDDVVFLRKLVKGGTSHSFGIQVAKMAGLPELVVQRSREILKSLESETPRAVSGVLPMPAAAKKTPQLDLFSVAKPSEVERIIGEIDVNRLTPLEALSLLTRLKDMIQT